MSDSIIVAGGGMLDAFVADPGAAIATLQTDMAAAQATLATLLAQETKDEAALAWLNSQTPTDYGPSFFQGDPTFSLAG